MEEITMFKAKDGKMFDDEDECRKYEYELVAKEVDGEITLFNVHRQPLPLDECDMENVFYARIATEKAFNWFKDMLYEQGTMAEGLHWYGEPDIYIWDKNDIVGPTWLSWHKIIEGIMEEHNELSKAGILKAWD